LTSDKTHAGAHSAQLDTGALWGLIASLCMSDWWTGFWQKSPKT